MTLTNREKNLLSTLLFLIFFSIYFYFLVFPRIDSIKESSLILEKEKIQMIEFKNIDTEEKLMDRSNEIQLKIEDIEKSLPDKENIPELYLHILSISDRTGIKQKEFIIQDTIFELIDNDEDIKKGENKQLLIIPIKHTFTSNYEGIKAYIEEIHNCKRKIDIIEYEIMQSKNNELDVSFTLHSYALTNNDDDHTDFIDNGSGYKENVMVDQK